MPKDGDDYEIGFGKPPRHTQFKKGASGNPQGRPKGSKSLAAMFNELAGEKMWVNTPNGRKRMSWIEMGIMQLLNRSAKGDARAIREVIQMKKTFGDALPQSAPPIIRVNFLKPKPYTIEPSRLESQDENIPVQQIEDEEEYEPAEPG